MLRRFSVALIPILVMVSTAFADLLTLNPTADARLLEFFPDSNFRADILSTFHAPGNEQHTVVLFDLSAIPANATINHAQLRLFGSSFYGGTSPTSLWAYRVTTAWLEDEVTWKTATTGQPWTNIGGDFVGTGGVQMVDPYATWSGNQPGFSPTWLELNMTDLVTEHHAGTYPNYGVGLAGPDGSQLVYISREGITSPNVPELVIDYTPIPEPAAALLMLAGGFLMGRVRYR